jgi:uncharacterized protein
VQNRQALADHKYVSVVTFRRDGTPVPTPLWVVRYDDALGILTRPRLGKVKRIRANPAVTVTPCTLRGKLLGDAVAGQAMILDPEETVRVRDLVKRKYGLLGRLIIRRYERRPETALGVSITLD